MKKITAFFLVFIVLCGSMCQGFALEPKKKKKVTINVYNWGEFISDGADGTLDVNEEFTSRTGIEVNYTTFHSNEELYAKLASGGASYDVIIVSDYMVSKLKSKNMLKKLDFGNIPNFSLIDENFRCPSYDATGEYSVPYAWGLVGIFYNKNIVKTDPAQIGWDILWDEQYKNQILMFDNSRDAFGISLIRLGKSVNSTNPDDWRLAAEELSRQKPLVQAYVMDQIFDKMANSEAAVAPYYSGDAVTLMKDHPEIGFVIPKEGTTKFVDAMCVPLSSQHPSEAEAYINFMCSTEIAKANIEKIGYSTPQTEVKKLLAPEISENEIFYPSEETLAKTQVFSSLPDDLSVLLDNLWIKVKTGENASTAALILFFVGFILLYIAIVFRQKRKKRR